MALQNFDELNQLSHIWYSKMPISESKKDKRIDLSLFFAEVILLFFDMVVAKKLTENEYKPWLKERLKIVADNHIGKDNTAYVNDWSDREAEKIAEVTIKHTEETEPETTIETTEPTKDKEEVYHFKEFNKDVPESEYWTSTFRGLILGIECASAIENYYELQDAIDRGYTHKIWVTEGDDKVRPTHVAVDRTDIRINEYFTVGDSYLLFPGDISQGASDEEVCNCRCVCKYY